MLDRIGDGLNVREDEELLDAQEELADFIGASYSPLEDYTNGGGAFDLHFDPVGQTLRIVLKLSYVFENGDPTAVVDGFRPEEFEWTSEEEAQWKADYHDMITQAWSGAYVFRSTQDHWNYDVAVQVEAVEDDADPHFVCTLAKYPPDSGSPTSSVCGEGSHHDENGRCPSNTDGTTSGTAELDSNDLRRAPKNGSSEAQIRVQFDKGSTRLRSEGQAALDPVSADLTANPDWWVRLRGRASSDHRDGVDAATGAIENMDLARARSEAVEDSLTSDGIASSRIVVENVGEKDATEDEQWCRVDVWPIDTQGMRSAVHEAGHMFGLGDEYVATGSSAGDPLHDASYSALITAQTGEVVTRHNDDGMMSKGETIETWHYSTFLAGFKELTGSTAWEIA